MPYVPHTPADIKIMCDVIGIDSVDDLFTHLPDEIRLKRPLDLPDGLTEEEVRCYFKKAAATNRGQDTLVSFLGGGVYDSIIPAAVDALVSRSEFLTAYTPYQPEVSQGTLQAIYEWQTYICRITGMDVANASMYDGATALSEALLVAIASKRKKTIILPANLNPRYQRVVATSMRGMGVKMLEAPIASDGTIDTVALAELVDDQIAAVVIQNPNYLGLVEKVEEVARVAADAGAILVAAVNPVSLSVLKSPAEYGAQIVVGEAQPFGIPTSWGGPLLGFMACTEKHKRRIPGRIVGRTLDNRGNNGYVLTLQTREQHIRREKATSNICSNQGLNALKATIYLSMLGAEGFVELGEANLVRSKMLRDGLTALAGVELPFDRPLFNELVVRLNKPASKFIAFARKRDVLPGIALAKMAGCTENDLLVAVTEKRTAEDINLLLALVAEFTAAEGEEVS